MKTEELTKEQELLLRSWKKNIDFSHVFSVFYFIDMYIYIFHDTKEVNFFTIGIVQLLLAVFFNYLGQKDKKAFLALSNEKSNKKEHKLTTLLREKNIKKDNNKG